MIMPAIIIYPIPLTSISLVQIPRYMIYLQYIIDLSLFTNNWRNIANITNLIDLVRMQI